MGEYEVAEPYDDRMMQDKQAGYSPVSPVASPDAAGGALSGSEMASLKSAIGNVYAEREQKALTRGIAAIDQGNAYVAMKEAARKRRWAMQDARFALAQDMAQLHRQQVMARANAYEYSNSNPDQEAMYQSMSKELGIPVEQIRENPEAYTQRLSAEQAANIVNNNPAMARYMSNPDNARVAKDDTSVLGAISHAIGVAGSMIRGFGAGLFEGSAGTAAGTVSAYGRAAPVASEMELMSMNPEAISGSEYMQRMEDMTKEGATSTVTIASDAVYKWSKETADAIAGDATKDYGWFARGMVSGARSMGSMLPGMAVSTLTMNPAAALISGGLSEGSQAFMEDIDKGRGLGTALTHAWWNGGTEVLTELIPVGGFLSDVAKKTPFWKSLLKNWARETPSELAATALQTGGDFVAEAAGDDIGGFLSGSMDSRKYAETMTQYLKQLPEAELETVIAVLPMSFGMSALGSIRRVRAANDMQQALKTLHENGDASKLRGRALDNYRQFIEVSKQGTPIENAYIDAKDFVEYFQSQEIDPKQAAEDFGIKNYEEAVMSNGKLEMPFENYMADFAASGHAQSLIETTTLNENIPSLKDSIVYEERIKNSLERVDKLLDEVDADRETMGGAFESINRVAQEYQRHLEAIGYTPETAATQATVAARMHVMPIIRDIESMAMAEGREATSEEIANAVTDRLNRYDLKIDRVSGRQVRIPRNLNAQLDPMLAALRAGRIPSASQVYGKTLTQAVIAAGGIQPTEDLRRRVREGELPSRILRKTGRGADELASESGFAGYMRNLDTEHMQEDDALIEALVGEHTVGQMTYDMANLNEDLLAEATMLGYLADDLGRAGIDLAEVTDDAEVRRMLAEYDASKYGEVEGEAGYAAEDTVSSYDQRGFTMSDNPTAEEIAEANRQYDEVVAKYKDTDQWMKAPNGEDTNLNERQWVQVRTENFKQWFGDWENDPGIASKVVDGNGEPKVMYHGTDSDFDTFVPQDVVHGRELGDGYYFTDDPRMAEGYGGTLMPVFLDVRNPFTKVPSRETATFQDADEAAAFHNEKIAEAEEKGNGYARFEPEVDQLPNGEYTVTYATSFETAPTEANDGYADGSVVVVYDSNQIKSAIGNVGTFNPGNDSILYQFIGEKGAAALDAAEEATVRMDNLAVAREMEGRKKPSKAIKLATGWERGADGKWRYEIPDIQINEDFIKKAFKGADAISSMRIDAAINAPELFAAYPDAKNIRLIFEHIERGYGGFYLHQKNQIVVESRFAEGQGITSDWVRSTLVHELQHAIQRREGFATGGNPANAEYYKQATDFNKSLYEGKAIVYRHAVDMIAAVQYLKQKERFAKNPNAFLKTSAWMQYGPAFGLPENRQERAEVIRNAIDAWQADVEKGGIKNAIELLDLYRDGYGDVKDAVARSKKDIKKYLKDNETYELFDAELKKMEGLTDFELYMRIAGEVEARNAAKRMNMTVEERLNSLASSTEDVDRKDQIFIRDSLGNARSVLQDAQSSMEGDRLMAVHNLSGENLVFADEMGGLAVPSIGIVGQERGEVSGFGEITLIGTKSLGDPRQNPVFSSDAYTSTFPRPVYKKVPMAKRESLDGIFKETDKVFRERLVSRLDACIDNSTPDRDRFENILHRSYTAKQAFLKSIGKEVPVVYEPYSHSLVPHDKLMEIKPFYEAVDWSVDMATAEASPEYKALADKFYEIRKEELKDLAKKMPKFAENMAKFEYKYGDQIADDLENYGKTEIDFQGTYGKIDEAIDKKYAAEFKSWSDRLTNDIFGDPMLDKGGRLVPYTLDNIVDVMTSDDARNKEDTLTYSTGQARAAAAQRFRNLEAMREKSKETIVDDAQYREAREKTEELLDGYRKTISKYTKLRAYDGGLDIFGAMDASMRAVGRYLAGGEFTESSFKDALKREDFKARIPSAIIKQGMEAAEALAKTPVPYFESKPQRAVTLDEFVGAVIPKNTPQNVRDILDKHGIRTFEYNDENRTEVTRQAAAEMNSGKTQTLFQKNADKRGAFKVTADRRFRIELFEKANFSTFAHECAHFQLEMLSDMVADPNASEYIKQEWQTICDYLGGDIRTLEGDARVEAHERFARSFEAYLMEGKAPSPELRTAFQRFKDWMVRIYQMLTNLNVKLSPDIRQVFDRMLASDAEIAQASEDEGLRETLMTAEDLGLNERETKALKRLYDRQIGEAQDKLRARYMKSFVRKRQQQYREEFAKAQKQAESEYEASALVDVGRMLTNPENRTLALNEAELVKRFGKDYLKQLPKFENRNIYSKDGGVFIDELAEVNGFESSEDLLQALENMPSKKEWVAQRAQEIVDTFFGDAVNAAEVSDEVSAAMNNNAKGERLRAEMQVLAKAVRAVEEGRKTGRAEASQKLREQYEAQLEELKHKVKEEQVKNRWDIAEADLMQAIAVGKVKSQYQERVQNLMSKIEDLKTRQAESKEEVARARREASEIRKDVSAQYDAMERVAKQAVSEKVVGDIRPNLYLNAMHKAMRESIAALNKATPDYAEAARLKQKEMFNYHLYRAARDAVKQLERGQKKMRDIANRKMEGLPKQRNIEMVYKAKYIAGSLLGRDVSNLVDKIATEEKYQGSDPFVYDIGKLKTLQYDDAMKAIEDAEDYWEQSLRDQKILAMGKLVDIETAGGEMAETLASFGPSNRKHNRRDTIKDRFQKAVGNFITSMTRMESWCDMVDGRNVGQETGAWKKYIFNPIKEAAQNARAEQKQYLHELGDILKEFNFTRQTVKMDELGGFVFGEDTGYAKMEIAHAFLHCGNRSNFQRLIVGHGWGTMLEDGTVDGSRWSRAVDKMVAGGIWTEADMDRVQRIWDLMDKLKPKLQEAYKTVNGKYFDEIQAEPFKMFGKEYAGGYVPAIYDPYKSKVGQKQEVKAEDILNTSGSFLAKLSDGFGVTRVQGVPGQLVLDLSKIGSHFNQQVLFANMAPVAADVGKLLRSKGVQAALMEYDPTFYQDVIVPWFSRAVTQNVYNGLPRKDAEERLLQKIRSRAGIATMFMNITNAIEGFFDLTATFSKVDGRHLRNAFMQMVTNRKATVEKILEMSVYMRERMDDNQNAAMEKLEQALHPNRLKVIDNWINDNAYFAQEMIDGFTGPVGFLGAYNQAIEAGLSHEEAVSQAESVVRAVHGTMMPEDLANRETGTVWKRLFTQFTGYFVQRANTVAAQHSKITRETSARQKAALTMLYLQTVFLPAWIGAMLRKAFGGSDDDETFGQWLLDVFGFGTASYVIGLFGATIPGQAASAALEMAQGNKMAQGRMFSSPATQLVANLVNPRRWVDNDGNIQWSNALRNLASWANIVPVVPVVPNRPVASVKYMIDTAEGKVEPTGVVDFVRGAVTGRASPDSKR